MFYYFYSTHFLALNSNSRRSSEQLGEGNSVNCLVCSKVCDNLDILMQHTRKCRLELQEVVDQVEKRMLTCTKCGVYFRQKIKFKKHKCVPIGNVQLLSS